MLISNQCPVSTSLLVSGYIPPLTGWLGTLVSILIYNISDVTLTHTANGISTSQAWIKIN